MKNDEEIDNEKRMFKIKRNNHYVPSASLPLGPNTRPVGNIFYQEYLRKIEESKEEEK